jgi:D-glycero-alpha-D-manno-heptose-7-phosphate kinase
MTMVISRTPYRVSFFGGGTDYHPWYEQHGGAVLATTINKYCYIHCRTLPPFFEHHSRVVWSQIELINDHAEIQHPVIRAALAIFGMAEGVEIHHHGDLPARSGIGSSSSFTVGMLHSLFAMRGQMVSKRELAQLAIHLERDVLHEQVGVQDQIATAIGGFNRIDIAADGSFEVQPLLISRTRAEELQDHLMLVFTGVSRSASEIAAEQVATIGDRKAVLRRMYELVDEGQRVLSSEAPLTDFGALLDETWRLKRSLTPRIAPTFVDEIYRRALSAGALGGKLLGAGGGGFMLFLVPPDARASVAVELADLIHVPFELETGGTQLVYYEPPRADRIPRTPDPMGMVASALHT